MAELLVTIIYLIAVFVVWNVIIFVIKKKIPMLYHSLTILSFLFFIIMGIFIALIYLDAKDFTENVKDSKNVFILVDDTTALAGITSFNKDTSLVTAEKLFEYTSALEDNNLKSLQGDAFKVFIIHTKAIDELPDFKLNTDLFTVTKEEALIILRDDNEAAKQVFEFKLANSEQLRSIIFSYIISDHLLGLGNQLFFIEQIKEENIIVYPETIIFASIKLIPTSFIPDTYLNDDKV